MISCDYVTMTSVFKDIYLKIEQTIDFTGLLRHSPAWSTKVWGVEHV